MNKYRVISFGTTGFDVIMDKGEEIIFRVIIENVFTDKTRWKLVYGIEVFYFSSERNVWEFILNKIEETQITSLTTERKLNKDMRDLIEEEKSNQY